MIGRNRVSFIGKEHTATWILTGALFLTTGQMSFSFVELDLPLVFQRNLYIFIKAIVSILSFGKLRFMIDNKNTWLAKTKRTFTAVLPISKGRKGGCINCGACCKLPNVCPFLKYTPENKLLCSIYPVRPLNCRKYPRTESEHITQETCGYRFE